MGSVPMRRTRRQWDEFYKNYYNEVKGKNQQTGGISGQNKRDNNSGKCKKKQEDIVIIGGKRGKREIIELSENFEASHVKRTKNVVHEYADLEHCNKNIAKSVSISDDEVEYLGEEVVSNGSSLNIESQSRSGLGSKVGNLDEVVSCNKREVEETRLTANDDDDVVLEKFTGSRDSTKSLDLSDNSFDSSESESSSEEDDFSDEDYNVSTSDDVSSSHNSVEREKDHEYDTDCSDSLVEREKENSYNTLDDKTTLDTLIKTCKRTNEKKESDDDDGYIAPKKTEDVVIIIDDKEKFPSVTRISGKKESEREDHVIDDGYHGNGDNKKRGKKKNEESVVIIVDDEKKCPNIGNNSVRIRKKRDGELAGMCYQPSPSYGCRDEVNDGIDKSGLKKRKVLVDSDKGTKKEDTSIANRLVMKEQERSKFSSPVPMTKSDEKKCHVEQCSKKETKTKKTRNLDLIKILVESINLLKEEKSHIRENDLTLPLKFRFEDEFEPEPEKSEWEKEMDSLYRDLELGLRESEIDYDNSCETEKDEINATEIDKSPAACCNRGEHEPILDEQIGIVCKYCLAVILDIKYVLPPFYIPPPRRQQWRQYDEYQSPVINRINIQDSASKTQDSTTQIKGTVWDLIPGVEKEMYPHQREGFEFIWKNIAGGISIEKLKGPLSDVGRGCIISHAPGTGKTRLTIVFLTTFLKLYPTCRPVIIAPRGMLLTWESEFVKWRANIPFNILNKKELSCNEISIASDIIGQVGVGKMDTEYIRLVKLYSWLKGGSILGISYHLYEKLAGENRKKGQNEQIKKLLLELPGLLVLDEGHTPRNEQSLMWKALAKVSTQRRIILSGTPFQNNMKELFNTLCLVNPKFVDQIGSQNIVRKKWTIMTSSIGKNRDNGLMKLKAMLDPFVHVHKGTILEERLLGLRDTLVFLHPTQLQKTLLETASKSNNIFHRIRLVSLVSVHPSLMPEKSKFEEIEPDIDAGVKTKFVMKLIWLADALNERVLVFSQYIDPLVFIKNQIMSHFSWNEGKEVLYMDGKLDEKQRQDSIYAFNDESSEAKVLFASERACSEGINLVGASRVVLLDTVWNPSVEKQAISRAYRLGQKRVVYVYRLFTSGTEVRQYASQYKKEHLSELIFSPVDGRKNEGDKSRVVSEDKILEAMVGLEGFSECFEKIIHQPKESDLVEIFGWG